MALKKATIEKLEAIKAAILAEPKLYNQGIWPEANDGHTCNSPCCYAGWAVWINNPDPDEYVRRLRSIHRFNDEVLAEELGLTRLQGKKLFACHIDYHYASPAGTKAAAIDGAARIDLFIKSGGRK